MRIRYCCQLVARLLTLGSAFLGLVAPQTAQAAWPIKQFEVFLGKPNRGSRPGGVRLKGVAAGLGFEVDDQITPSIPASHLPIKEIETYLNEVAEKYDALGFAPPSLQPVVTRSDGSQAFRIYLYDFPPADPKKKPSPPKLTYSYSCDGILPRMILVDIQANTRNKQFTPIAYQNLAHELFHAVQMGQPLYKKPANCSLGDWITEGTADAMGVDMARMIEKIDMPNRTDAWADQRWGIRRYDRPLWVADDDPKRTPDDYQTSSFWRYLAEHAALGGSPGVSHTEPDYSYLAHFFRRDLGSPPSEQAEMKWINQALLDHPKFKLGLDRFYPNFINTFAAFPNNRFVPAGYTRERADNWWREKLFASCPEFMLSPNRPHVTYPVRIPRNSSWCAVVHLQYPGTVDLAVQASGPAASVLQALTLGAGGGAIVAKPMLARSPQIPARFKDLAFVLPHLEGSKRHLLILSNVALAPESSVTMDLSLDLSVTDLFNTMFPQSIYSRGPGQAPPPAANPAGLSPAARPPAQPKPGSPALAPAKAPTLNTLADRRGAQLRQGMDSLTPHLAMAGNVSRTPQEPQCKDAFKFDPCGPTTSISSSFIPAISPNLEASAGRGGLFGQFATLLAGYGSAGVVGSSSALWGAGQKAYDLDGSSVTIIVPLIDYGFTGTFNNAVVQVHKAGGGNYEALGPRDVLPGPGTLYPLSGRVTIEEYSPSILRGTFRAAVVDTAKLEITSEDMTLPVHAEVEGRFAVVAPWRSDERVERELSEEPEESVLRDMIGMFPGQQSKIEEALKRAKASRPAPASGTNTGHTVRGGCDCSCNAAPTASLGCRLFCAATYEACEGQQAGLVASNTPAAPPVEAPAGAAEAATLRGRYTGLLEQVYKGPRFQSVREMMLRNFDQQKTMREKQVMYDLVLEKLRR